jgi:hypothetical protein
MKKEELTEKEENNSEDNCLFILLCFLFTFSNDKEKVSQNDLMEIISISDLKNRRKNKYYRYF